MQREEQMKIRGIMLGLLMLLGPAACDESPVSLPEPAAVSVPSAVMALAVGDEAPIAAQVMDQDGRAMQGQAVVYSTDNASVATVGAGGMVRGVAPGTASITAASGSSTATVRVTVTAASMTVTLPRTTLALAVGGEAPVAAQVLDAGGRVLPGAALAYSTDNPSVATVGTDGTIRGVAPGTARIAATYGASAASVDVTVTSANVTIRLPGTTLALAVGDASPLGAQVLDAQGRVVPGAVLAFSTDNPAVAAVGTDGVVRGVTPGTASVMAAYGSSSAAVQVTVTANRREQVQVLEILADSLVADRRAGVQVVAVRATNGFGQTVCPSLILQSSDPSVATARMAGTCRIEVTPLFTGETTITAEADGGSTDTFRVRVTNTGAVVFFDQRPAAASLVAGDTVSYTIQALNGAGNPIVGQRVNLDVSAGGLLTSAVTTDSAGNATVRWVLPVNLRELGHTHTISYRAPLPNGGTASGSESVFVNGAALASITLYYSVGWQNQSFIEVPASGSIQVPSYYDVNVGARGKDRYGNDRVTDFSFSVGPNVPWWSCGGSAGTVSSSGIEYTCIWGGSATYTVTAIGGQGVQKSVQVIYQ
jgi:uncharacterized protein YjdB